MHLQQLLSYYLFIIIIIIINNNITIAIIVIIIIIISILFLILMGFLRFNKIRLSERFSLLADTNCFCLNSSYSVLTFLYFHTITNLDSHSYHYHFDYFCCYCFCHCHCHYHFFIYNAFNFCFSSFYHSILSLYIVNIFKF